MSGPSGQAGPGGEDPQPPTVPGDGPERDEKVLALREEGRTFAGIARELGLEGTLDANAAFIRALRRRPPSEQESLRTHEIARLDALAERVRRREDLDEAEVARRIRSLDRLRKTLLSA
jgi:hypothetical protein